jgi:hypothetical protein
VKVLNSGFIFFVSFIVFYNSTYAQVTIGGIPDASGGTPTSGAPTTGGTTGGATGSASIGGAPSGGNGGPSVGSSPSIPPTNGTVSAPGTAPTTGPGISIGQPTTQPQAAPSNFVFFSASSYYLPAWDAFNAATGAAAPAVMIGVMPGTTPAATPAAYAPVSQTIIGDYQTALADFAKVYTDPAITSDGSTPTIQIDGSDPTNFIVQVVQSMSSAFVNNALVLKKVIDQQILQNQPFDATIAQLVQQISQYTTDINGAQQYVQVNWNTLYNGYLSQMNGLLFSVYNEALNSIALTAQNKITAALLQDAQAYYSAASALLTATPTLIGFTSPTFTSSNNALQAIQASMGAIATNGFSSIVNTLMVPEASLSSLSDVIGANAPNRTLLQSAISYAQVAAAAGNSQFSAMVSALSAALSGFDIALGAGDIIAQVAALTEGTPSPIGQLIQGGAQWYASHITAVCNLLAANSYAQTAPTAFSSLSSYKQRLTALASVITTTDTANADNLQDFFGALASACSTGIETYDNAQSNYNEAATAQGVQSNPNPPLTSSQVATARAGATAYQVDDIISNVQQGSTAFQTALQNLTGTSDLADVQTAQQNVQTALNFFASADNAYTAWQANVGAQSSTIIPFYSMIPGSADGSLTIFAAQYIVHLYRALAAPLKSATDAASQALFGAYYLNAFAITSVSDYNFASDAPSVVSDVTTTLKSQSSIIQNASAALSAVLKLDATKPTDPQTLTQLTNNWSNALSQTLAAYTMWAKSQGGDTNPFREGPSLYLKCLQCYINSYAVSTLTDNGLTKAVLLYRLYLLVSASPNIESRGDDVACYVTLDPSSIVNDIAAIINPFLSQGSSNVTAAQSQNPDEQVGYKTALVALQALYTWQVSAQQLFSGAQQALTDQTSATSAAANLKSLFESSGTEAGSCATSFSSLTYTSPLIEGSPSVSLGNVVQQLADLYQKQGDWAVAAAVSAVSTSQSISLSGPCELDFGYHGIANAAYSQAQNYYQLACDTTTASVMANLTSVEAILATADLAFNGIKPVVPDTTTFVALGTQYPVYARYFISPYFIQVPQPPAIVYPSNLPTDHNNLVQNPTNTTLQSIVLSDNITFAAALYLYQHMNILGLSIPSGDYVTPVTSSSYGGLTGSSLNVAQEAQAYKAQLNTWATTGLAIGSNQNVQTSMEFFAPSPTVPPALVYCNLPIIQIPDVNNPSQNVDPTAATMYSQALQGYQEIVSKFSGDSSMASQVSYAQSRITQAQNAIALTYLSAAYALYMKFNYMIGVTVDPTVLNLVIVDPNEKTALDTHKATLAKLKGTSITSLSAPASKPIIQAINFALDYINVAYGFIATAVQGDGYSTPVPAAQGVQGYLYEMAADFYKMCLVGDTQSVQYKSYADNAFQLYTNAIGAYQVAQMTSNITAVYEKIGAMYEMIGDTINIQAAKQTTASKSAQYYAEANGQYGYASAVQNYLSAQDSTSAARSSLKGLVSIFSAVQGYFSAWYQVRWQSPITLGSQSYTSTSTQTAFEQVLPFCLTGQVTLSPAEQTFCTTTSDTILNSLVYLDYLQEGWLQNFNTTFASVLKTPITQPTSGAGEQQDDPNVTAYLGKFSTSTSSQNGSQLSSGTLVGDILSTGSMSPSSLQAFITGLVLNGNATSLGQFTDLTDATNLAVALNTSINWATALYSGIGNVYIALYEGNPCAQGDATCIGNKFATLAEEIKQQALKIFGPNVSQYISN